MELVQYIVEKPKDKSKYKVGYKKNEKLNSIPTDSYPIKCLNGIFLGKKEEDNIIVYKGIPFENQDGSLLLNVIILMIFMKHILSRKILYK